MVMEKTGDISDHGGRVNNCFITEKDVGITIQDLDHRVSMRIKIRKTATKNFY